MIKSLNSSTLSTSLTLQNRVNGINRSQSQSHNNLNPKQAEPALAKSAETKESLFSSISPQKVSMLMQSIGSMVQPEAGKFETSGQRFKSDQKPLSVNSSNLVRIGPESSSEAAPANDNRGQIQTLNLTKTLGANQGSSKKQSLYTGQDQEMKQAPSKRLLLKPTTSPAPQQENEETHLKPSNSRDHGTRMKFIENNILTA